MIVLSHELLANNVDDERYNKDKIGLILDLNHQKKVGLRYFDPFDYDLTKMKMLFLVLNLVQTYCLKQYLFYHQLLNSYNLNLKCPFLLLYKLKLKYC